MAFNAAFGKHKAQDNLYDSSHLGFSHRLVMSNHQKPLKQFGLDLKSSPISILVFHQTHQTSICWAIYNPVTVQDVKLRLLEGAVRDGCQAGVQPTEPAAL